MLVDGVTLQSEADRRQIAEAYARFIGGQLDIEIVQRGEVTMTLLTFPPPQAQSDAEWVAIVWPSAHNPSARARFIAAEAGVDPELPFGVLTFICERVSDSNGNQRHDNYGDREYLTRDQFVEEVVRLARG